MEHGWWPSSCHRAPSALMFFRATLEMATLSSIDDVCLIFWCVVHTKTRRFIATRDRGVVCKKNNNNEGYSYDTSQATLDWLVTSMHNN